MTIDTQNLRNLVSFDFELPVSVGEAVDNACDYIDAREAEIERLRVALTTIKEWPSTSPLNMDAHNMQVVAIAALSGEGK